MNDATVNLQVYRIALGRLRNRGVQQRLHGRDRLFLTLGVKDGEELLKAILEDFGLPAGGATRKELLDVLNLFLLEIRFSFELT